MARFGKAFSIFCSACWLLVLSGCVQFASLSNPFNQLTPEQKLEKELDIGVVGDVTEVGNGGAIQVSGVGLVMGLEGTGGSPPGDWRTMMEQQLRKQKVDNTRALLDNPNNALVLVTAKLPAGVRRGETIDLEIVLPPGSKATSLKGGYLAECSLRNYENAKNINPDAASSLLPGHVLAKAKGSLIVGLGNPDDAAELRRARIWGGATSLIERPFYFLLTKEEMKKSKVANNIAARLNLQFQDDPRKKASIQEHSDLLLIDGVTQQINRNFEGGFGKGEMAKATGKETIAVRVPYAYRFNPERFLRVARVMPLNVPNDIMHAYRVKLDAILLDPKQTMRASLRLEALGKEAMPTLKKGLESSEPLVRFCCAESLAYMGSTAGIEELARLAVDQPKYQAYCLLAMAGLDESICRQKLGELMTVDNPQLRSGAFRALRLLDDLDPRLGEDDAGPFFLHKVSGGSEPLVTFSTSKRAEVVIYGPDVIMTTPLKVLAGGQFTITAEAGDERITVSRFTTKGGVQRKQCTLLFDDVLHSMVDLGAGYPEIIDLLRNLDEQKAMPCMIRESAVPTGLSIEELLETELKKSEK